MRKITPRDNPCYCINFRRSANTLTKFYDKAFEPIHLSTNQFSLLNDINLLKSCNKSELAQFTRLDRTTIIRSLNVLIEKQLVEEVGDNNRNKVVRLTKAGEMKIEEGLDLWKEAQNYIKTIIGPENISVLKDFLKKLDSLNENDI